jgi:hypothetical protein
MADQRHDQDAVVNWQQWRRKLFDRLDQALLLCDDLL